MLTINTKNDAKNEPTELDGTCPWALSPMLRGILFPIGKLRKCKSMLCHRGLNGDFITINFPSLVRHRECSNGSRENRARACAATEWHVSHAFARAWSSIGKDSFSFDAKLSAIFSCALSYLLKQNTEEGSKIPPQTFKSCPTLNIMNPRVSESCPTAFLFQLSTW